MDIPSIGKSALNAMMSLDSEPFTVQGDETTYEGVHNRLSTSRELQDAAAAWGAEVTATVVMDIDKLPEGAQEGWEGKTVQLVGETFLIRRIATDIISATLVLVDPFR